MIQIQANINGFTGRPATVLGALDEDTGILVVAAVADRLPRRDGCVLIETDNRADRDSLFEHSSLKEAITAYYDLKGSVAEDGRSALLRFTDRAMRAEPASVIEVDGVDIDGPAYRISPLAGNVQIGALALCWYAHKVGAVNDAANMADELSQLLRGQVWTV